MKPFTLIKPKSASDAVSAKTINNKFVGGGTNLLDLMKKHIVNPDELITVAHVLSQHISTDEDGLVIGAMVRNSTAASDQKVISQYPLISKALLAGASPQIRNMASIAGNLLQRTRCPYFYDTSLPCNKRRPKSGCGMRNGENRMAAIVGSSTDCVAVHPSDLCVALAALDATVYVMNAAGDNRKNIPFADFHRLPGNTPERDNNLPEDAIITAVRIPKNPFSKHFAYLKLRDRDSYAFALVSVAAALHIEKGTIVEARLASGGVAHKPWRWFDAEKFLKGKKPTPEVFSAVAKLVGQETTPLAGNAFKKPMLEGAIEVALNNCLIA